MTESVVHLTSLVFDKYRCVTTASVFSKSEFTACDGLCGLTILCNLLHALSAHVYCHKIS